MNDLDRFEKSVKFAGLRPNDNVLDLGCGNAFLERYLQAFTPLVLYTGIDKTGSPMVRHDLETGLPASIKSERFNVIFMLEFLEHVENFKTLLKECEAILRDDGKIIISTPSAFRLLFSEDPTHIHAFRDTNMVNLAREIGLEITARRGLYTTIPFTNWKFDCDSFFLSSIKLYMLKRVII